MSPAFLADLVVVLHVSYLAFVVVGQLLILVGCLRRWGWIRNVWFRLLHLVAIGAVALEALLDIECPLTTWEASLRVDAGQAVDGTSFIGRLLHDLLFVSLPESAFVYLHVGFALLVVGTLVLVPPRLGRRKDGKQAPQAVADCSRPSLAPASPPADDAASPPRA